MTPMEMYLKMQENAVKHKTIDCKVKVRVVVQLGRCSQAAGAQEVLNALKKVVLAENMEDVTVETTGCMGMCSLEPIVTIRKTGRKPVTYCRVTPEMARVALSQYVYRDSIIKPWILDGEGTVV